MVYNEALVERDLLSFMNIHNSESCYHEICLEFLMRI